MQRIRKLCVLGVVLVGLLLNACGDSVTDRPASNAVPDSSASGDEEVPSALGFTADGRRPAIDGELRIALARPSTVSPADLSPAQQEAVIVADLLYDGLTEADTREGALRPALATAWRPDADASEWTFVVDTDRTSQDAVVSHFASLKARATGTTAVVVDQVISVEPVGSDRVRFHLATPNAGFPWLLSGVGLAVVGEDAAPTGRYDVVSDDDETLVLHDRLGIGPDVRITWAATARDAYNLLTLGAVDAAVAPPDALDDARTRYGVSPAARAVARFYAINTRSARLTDPRLREALLAAVDRSAIVAEAIDVPAFALDGVIAPTLIGFARSGCGRSCVHDPARAERLVADVAGDDPGAIPQIRIGATSDQESVAAAIADDLAGVGIGSMVVVLEPDGLAAAVAGGEVELYAAGWIAPATSMDAVAPLLASPSPVGVDVSDSGDVGSLLERAATTVDDAARWSLLAEAHGEAMASGVVLPLAIAKDHLVAAPQVQGLPVRADGSLELFGFE